jgi:hypothetical protein
MVTIPHSIDTTLVPVSGSLRQRRQAIRRRRRAAGRDLASGAGWGVVILVSGWLLLSGIFGLPGA